MRTVPAFEDAVVVTDDLLLAARLEGEHGL
jgi:hypothetical protein